MHMWCTYDFFWVWLIYGVRNNRTVTISVYDHDPIGAPIPHPDRSNNRLNLRPQPHSVSVWMWFFFYIKKTGASPMFIHIGMREIYRYIWLILIWRNRKNDAPVFIKYPILRCRRPRYDVGGYSPQDSRWSGGITHIVLMRVGTYLSPQHMIIIESGMCFVIFCMIFLIL